MKRYTLLTFPGLNGDPWDTDCFALARFFGFVRSLVRIREVRIIDNRTGRHYVY